MSVSAESNVGATIISRLSEFEKELRQNKLNLARTFLIQGDCLNVMDNPSLHNKFDLIVADPPYNQGVDYGNGQSDKRTPEHYRVWTKLWLRKAVNCLSVSGNLWVIISSDWASLVDTFCREELGLERADWCIWHYRFAQCIDSAFARSFTHLLHFRFDKNAVWNPDSVLVPSDRLRLYKDPRIAKSARKGYRVPLDVWGFEEPGFCRIQGNNKQRRKLHPNQLPEQLVARIVKSCSHTNSWVMDPFSGSGTTATVCRALGRNSVGIDIRKEFVDSAAERVGLGPVEKL